MRKVSRSTLLAALIAVTTTCGRDMVINECNENAGARAVQILISHKSFCRIHTRSCRMKAVACRARISYRVRTMKERPWLPIVTSLVYCLDKELYKAIDYLREQVRVLVEHQEKQDKRIRLNNSQRMRVKD